MPKKTKKMSSTSDQPDVYEEKWSSEEQVYSWRWTQLWNAGYDSRLCEHFAAQFHLDLHQLVESKSAGMTDVQALQIFG